MVKNKREMIKGGRLVKGKKEGGGEGKEGDGGTELDLGQDVVPLSFQLSQTLLEDGGLCFDGFLGIVVALVSSRLSTSAWYTEALGEYSSFPASRTSSGRSQGRERAQGRKKRTRDDWSRSQIWWCSTDNRVEE